MADSRLCVEQLGLRTTHDGDAELVEQLMDAMAATSADFTNTFR